MTDIRPGDKTGPRGDQVCKVPWWWRLHQKVFVKIDTVAHVLDLTRYRPFKAVCDQLERWYGVPEDQI
jgi:hypothetical protein